MYLKYRGQRWRCPKSSVPPNSIIAKFIRLLRNRTLGALDQILRLRNVLLGSHSGLGTFLQSVYILVKFCRWFKFSFLLFQTTIPPKQRKIKFKPRIKLIHNIHIWSSDLRRRKQHLDSWLGKEALLILSYHLFQDSSWWQLFYDLWAFLLDFIDKRLFKLAS